MGARRHVGTLALLLAAAAACSTDAVGVDACKQIEAARCKAAGACSVALEPPHAASGSQVDACIRFYDIACLHGLALGSDPGSTAVNACVAAIGDHPCRPDGGNLVLYPEKDPDCAWLLPPSASPEAGAGSSDGGAPPDAASTASDAAGQ
jgi:hypothetical protein